MQIEITRKGTQRMATITCDGCGETQEAFNVDVRRNRGRKGGYDIANTGNLHKQMIGKGWAIRGKSASCPSCEAKPQVSEGNDMTTASSNVTKITAKVEPNRTPTRAEKRQIHEMLDGCYDVDHERYSQGDTDDTIAEVLGVLPGWVAEIREEFFGPAGGNEDMEKLAVELDEQVAALKGKIAKIDSNIDEMNKVKSDAANVLAQTLTLSDQLAKIKKAVGPRITKQAGVM